MSPRHWHGRLVLRCSSLSASESWLTTKRRIGFCRADCTVGTNELEGGRQTELTKLNGDITCSYCCYSAQLAVIGYTTAHLFVSERRRGRCGKQACHSSQAHLIHIACLWLCAATLAGINGQQVAQAWIFMPRLLTRGKSGHHDQNDGLTAVDAAKFFVNSHGNFGVGPIWHPCQLTWAAATN